MIERAATDGVWVFLAVAFVAGLVLIGWLMLATVRATYRDSRGDGPGEAAPKNRITPGERPARGGALADYPVEHVLRAGQPRAGDG